MKIISVIFHPLLIATIMSALLFGTSPEIYPGLQPAASAYFISAIFIITCILPAISIFFMKISSIISSFELVKRTERFYPFAIIAIYYGVAAYLFTVKIQIGSPFDIIIISVAILIAILLIVSFRFKISVHATATWGAVGFSSALIVVMGLDLGIYYYLLITAAGLTSASRLYLGYHSPREIWSGTIFGFIYSFLTIYLFY